MLGYTRASWGIERKPIKSRMRLSKSQREKASHPAQPAISPAEVRFTRLMALDDRNVLRTFEAVIRYIDWIVRSIATPKPTMDVISTGFREVMSNA